VNWWKENHEEGNKIVAAGLSWPIPDVKLNQSGAIMLNINQNMGAFGLPGGKPLCESLPEEAPRAPKDAKGWGVLFGGPDCVAGYAAPTWDLFSETYLAAGVAQKNAKSAEGLDSSIIGALVKDGIPDKYTSNKWIGRLGPQ
jgi:hypothetical protein